MDIVELREETYLGWVRIKLNLDLYKGLRGRILIRMQTRKSYETQREIMNRVHRHFNKLILGEKGSNTSKNVEEIENHTTEPKPFPEFTTQVDLSKE